MLYRNIVIGLLLIVLSALFFAGTWSFPDDGGHVSPRVFPRMIAGCMFILASILVGQSFLERLRNVIDNQSSVSIKEYAQRWWRIVSVFIVGFAYTQVLDSFGYVVSTIPFLAAMVMLFQEKRWYVIVAVALLGTSIFYIVFRLVFKVPLPRFGFF